MSTWFEEVMKCVKDREETFTISDVADMIRPLHADISLKYLKEKISRTLNSMQRWNYVRAVGRSYINGKNTTTWEWVGNDDTSESKEVQDIKQVITSLKRALDTVRNSKLHDDGEEYAGNMKQIEWSIECAIEKAEIVLTHTGGH